MDRTGSASAVPRAGTVQGFCIVNGDGQDSSGSLVVTIQKNGVDTGITYTLTSANTSTAYTANCDSTNNFAVSLGDKLAVKFVNNATGTSMQVVAYSLGVN